MWSMSLNLKKKHFILDAQLQSLYKVSHKPHFVVAGSKQTRKTFLVFPYTFLSSYEQIWSKKKILLSESEVEEPLRVCLVTQF